MATTVDYSENLNHGGEKVGSAPVSLGNSTDFSMASFCKIYSSLMLVIAKSTDKEWVSQTNYLKAENQTLRSRLPARISLTQREKNHLIRFATNLEGVERIRGDRVSVNDTSQDLRTVRKQEEIVEARSSPIRRANR